MSQTDEFANIEKEIGDKISDIRLSIESAVENETEKLGKYLIGLMKNDALDGADMEASESGYSSSYVAMCYEDHYYQRHAFDVIPQYMKYELDQYELPEKLAELANRFYPDYEPDSFADYIAVDKAQYFEHQIREGAMEYAWDEIHCDSDTAAREAIRRGELHIDREWTTFRDSDKEDPIVDKASLRSEEKFSKNYERLREKLFGYFGTRFVENFINRVIKQLKKQPSSENFEEVRAICTAWDEICVDWENYVDEEADEDFEDVIKDTIFSEYDKLNAPEKMLLWYFNTYRQFSNLEELFDNSETGANDDRVKINSSYFGQAVEIANVIWRRIMLRARDYTNYRIDSYNFDEGSQDTLNENYGDAVSEWNYKTVDELTAAYKNMFEEDFPLEPETNEETLLQCLASDTPWSKDTDLLIAEEPTYDDDEEETDDNEDTEENLTPWERRLSYFFPMVKDKNRIETKQADGLFSITLRPDEDLDETRKSTLTPFAEKLDDIVKDLNWFVVNDDGQIVIVWDNMIPVYGDVHVNTENLADTAKQVREMVKSLDTNIILNQLVDYEGCDETGKPNNFYEIVRLTDAYESDLKVLSERLDEAVEEKNN